MPTYNTDGAYDLRALTGANPISDVDAGFAALRDDIDGTFAGYSEGPFGSRPTSTPGTPGIAGREYYATDTNPKRRYKDTGTGWIEIAQIERSSQTWNPPSLAHGAVASVPMAFAGGLAGSPAILASFSNPLPGGVFLTAHYSALLNGPLVTLVNLSGTTQDIASGTLMVVVIV